MITPTDNSIKTKQYNKTKTNNNMWGAIIGAALSAVAAIASSASNRKFQKKTMREQNEFNSNEAQVTREWNQQMDNTKYQRQVADMQAAGVNPALAMNGGVTTQATSNATASSGSGIPGGLDLSSVMQMAVQMQQLKLQKKLIDSQSNKNNAEAVKIGEETSWIAGLSQAQIDKMKADADKAFSDIQVNQSEIEVNGHKINMYDAQTGLYNAEMSESEKRSQLVETQNAIAKLDKQKLEKLLPYVENYQKSIIALNNAQTEEAYQRAYSDYASACNSFADASLKENIVDTDYYRKLGGQIDASTGQIKENTKLTAQQVKTEYWRTKLTNQQTQTEYWRTKSEKRSYRWQGVNNAVNNTCKIVNSACIAFSTFSPSGGSSGSGQLVSGATDILALAGI